MIYLIFIICIINTIILIYDLRESTNYNGFSYFIKSINLFTFLIIDALLFAYILLTF